MVGSPKTGDVLIYPNFRLEIVGKISHGDQPARPDSKLACHMTLHELCQSSRRQSPI